MCEITSQLEAPVYGKICVNNPANIIKAKGISISNTIENKVYSFINYCQVCPTNWAHHQKMSRMDRKIL